MTTDALTYAADSAYAWRRLAVALLIGTVGGVGLWSTVVVLPSIEAEFGTGRGGASLPYSATLIFYALGGIVMGRLVDRLGIAIPVALGGALMGLGYIATAYAQTYWHFVAGQAFLIGFGSSVAFGPLVADISLWFKRRRGIAVALVASGNYLAGTVWPPIIQRSIAEIGWRDTHFAMGVICICAMVPLALLIRRRPDLSDHDLPTTATAVPEPGSGKVRAPMPRAMLQALLVLAGIACCVAMSMPQVHIVAYCVDLGYGSARGAEMLSVMLGLGIVSRLVSGLIADKIGGLGTLILGSTFQAIALFLYLPFDGLVPLYIVSAVFGLSQGGIVPSYALIVRDYFPAREAGTRVSLVLMATVAGMALGGWMSGAIYDLTGSYQAAFWNGIAWNFLNILIAGWLLMTRRPQTASAPATG